MLPINPVLQRNGLVAHDILWPETSRTTSVRFMPQGVSQTRGKTHLRCYPSVMWGRASALPIAHASRPEGLPHMTTQVNRGFKVKQFESSRSQPAFTSAATPRSRRGLKEPPVELVFIALFEVPRAQVVIRRHRGDEQAAVSMELATARRLLRAGASFDPPELGAGSSPSCERRPTLR